VTQNTLRIVKVFWALDSNLADKRHFPSINWLKSYSLYLDKVEGWWKSSISGDWLDLRNRSMTLLQQEAELQEIIQLVGPDALPPSQQVTLETTRMLREDFLQQNAFHDVDSFCPESKQVEMLRTILLFNDLAQKNVSRGISVDSIRAAKCRVSISRMAKMPNESFKEANQKVVQEITAEMSSM
jgi:V/A-type H+-transporting ATPase subunit A